MGDQVYAAATAKPAMPQKLTGSMTASLRYSRLIFRSAINYHFVKGAPPALASKLFRKVRRPSGARLARPCGERGRLLLAAAQKPHAALVFEQLVLQLHVHRLALDLLHLVVDARGAELKFRLGGRGSAVYLFAHLVEGQGVVAQLERRHRLRE